MRIITEKGFYKVYEYCESCGLELFKEASLNNVLIIRKTILRTNELPIYCPVCGAKLLESKK